MQIVSGSTRRPETDIRQNGLKATKIFYLPVRRGVFLFSIKNIFCNSSEKGITVLKVTHALRHVQKREGTELLVAANTFQKFSSHTFLLL